MDYKYYERKINDIIMKCPIEAGVEILVYNVLDNIVESKGLSLVDINRLWKDRDPRLTNGAGIPRPISGKFWDLLKLKQQVNHFLKLSK